MLFDIIPDRWRSTTLGEICEEGGGDIQTGPFGSQLHASDYVEDGIPSIMPANIRDGRVSEEGIARITVFDAERLSKYLVREGDIVYSRRGDVERCALIRNRQSGWLCGTGCLRVRPGIGVIESDFCAHFLSHPETKEWVSRHAVGATMPNLNTQILSSVPILLPPPEEQKAIAHILGTLDDKIELNRKTNETLEAMAKALFKSWFVDFDPVKAKAEGRPTGLPDEISDLFPDSFEDSELGEIPSGWEVGFLGDHTDLIKGRSYKSDELNPSTTALVTLKSFQRNGGYRSDGLKQFTGEYKEQQVVKPGELVVALTDVTQAADVIGRPAIVKSDSFCSKLVASLDVGIIRPKGDGRLATPYLYSLMLTPGYVQHVLGYTSGTTVLHLAKDATAKFSLPIPGASIADHYCRLAGSILHQIDASDRQSELLAKTRDALLPKLISGEIRIPDAERMLEEVGI